MNCPRCGGLAVRTMFPNVREVSFVRAFHPIRDETITLLQIALSLKETAPISTHSIEYK